MSRTVAFRVEAGPVTGFGHLNRCVALAQQLAGDGVRAVFCTSAQGDFARQRMATATPAGETGSLEDAQRFLEIAQRTGADWLVVDGYLFPETYLSALRSDSWKVLFIDDDVRLPSYPVDLLLDQNFGAETRSYPLAAGARALLGPRYALLDRKFRSASRKTGQPREVRRALITTGGGDQHNTTERLLQWLLKMSNQVAFDVVAGLANPSIDTLRHLAQSDPRVTLHISPPGLFDLMQQADIAITAGGTTLWELAALGVPSLVVLIAENQRPHTEAMSAQGIVHLLGWHADITEQALASAFNTLLSNHEARSRMAQAARQVIDGLGAGRVAREMYG